MSAIINELNGNKVDFIPYCKWYGVFANTEIGGGNQYKIMLKKDTVISLHNISEKKF